MIIRITEELIAEGGNFLQSMRDVLLSVGDLSTFGQAKSMKEMTRDLKAHGANEAESCDDWFTVRANREFFPSILARCGEAVASAIRKGVSSLLEPNFNFFGLVLCFTILLDAGSLRKETLR